MIENFFEMSKIFKFDENHFNLNLFNYMMNNVRNNNDSKFRNSFENSCLKFLIIDCKFEFRKIVVDFS